MWAGHGARTTITVKTRSRIGSYGAVTFTYFQIFAGGVCKYGAGVVIGAYS